MNTKNKTCFVISPIGPEGSEIRSEADDLFELVIEPALQPYNFDVIRADRIPRPSVITSDIIQLVQTSDLCIIDLTRQNPNVFYECGRRHETGRPFIQLIKRGESLPFDVSGIRTIEFDITTPRTTHESVRAIQRFVEELGAGGYEPTSSGESLSSIASSLERIERKLNQLSSDAASVSNLPASSVDPLKMFQDPRSTFMEAIASGDITTARSCLHRLEQLLGLGEDLAFYSGLLAQAGDTNAADILKRILTTNRTLLSEQVLKSALANLVSFYVLTDREREGLEVVSPMIEELLRVEELSPEMEAFYLNQTQKLRYGCGEFELALKDAERCIELQPDEPAYFFNLSLIYQRLNLIAKAVEMVDRYMKLPNPSDSGLSHAVELYAEVGRVEDARTVFIALKEKNPSKANRLLFGDSNLRRLLSPT